MRAAAQAEKRPLSIRSPWRDRDPKEAPEGAPYTIRLKAPREGETVIEDQVQGRVVFANKELDDLNLVRSDGNPTYNLAVVVDDAMQGITDVTRGEDLLASTHVHRALQKLLGLPEPVYHHHRLIVDNSGKRLAKRDDALSVRALRKTSQNL